MEQDAGLATSIGELADRLDRADFVVDPHYADERAPALDRRLERGRLDLTGCRYGEDDFLATQMLHGVCRCETRLVIGGGDRDAERSTAIARRECSTDDREIVGFGAARREHHLIRLGPKGAGDRALRLFYAGARGATEPMGPRGISAGF